MDAMENTVEVECINLQYGEGFSIAGHEDQVFTIVGIQEDACENEAEEDDSDHEEEEEEDDDEATEVMAEFSKRSHAPHWPTEVTCSLIATRLSMESDFSQGTTTRQLWRNIAATMISHGHQVTAAECLSKWKNLLTTYRKNKDRTERDGAHNVTWEHFAQLHAAFGQFAQDLPPANYLRASTSSGLQSSGWSVDRFVEAAMSAKTRLGTSANSICDLNPNLSASVATPRALSSTSGTLVITSIRSEPFSDRRSEKRKQTACGLYNTPPLWFRDEMVRRVEIDKRRAQQREELWKEYRLLEERKAEAMSRLVVAAAGLHEDRIEL